MILVRLIFRLPAAIAAIVVLLALSRAEALETAARAAILIDITSDTVLLEKDADTRMPTASMSKIMTMYMLFEALEQGRIGMDDTLPVSEYAWRKGGSKMFVEVNDRIRVEDLIRGVIIQSGNDASIVIAEGLSGSEEAFAAAMTERARELGMTGSNFTNSTGWPDPEHYSTPRDLALLARRLIEEFPQYYGFYSEREFTFNDITQQNRNPLLYRDVGADGLKTGHTEEAGYGLAASAERDGRRLVMVISGLPSSAARSEESERLIDWGFREFELVDLFAAGQEVQTAEVWMGDARTVPLTVENGLTLTLPRSASRNLTIVARVEEPIQAPIEAGARLGTMVISAPDMPAHEVPLLAGAAVERQGFIGRIGSTLKYLVLGGGN